MSRIEANISLANATMEKCKYLQHGRNTGSHPGLATAVSGLRTGS